MNWISKYLAIWQSRIVLGFVFVCSVAIGLWPDQTRSIDPGKLVACFLAGSTWLVAEFASAVTNVSQHDVMLFQRINNTMNDQALTFLVDHDFGNDCNVRDTTPISTMATWHGPNFMFKDKTIQKRWHALFDQILGLSELYGSTLVNTEHSVERLTAWLLGFPRNAQPLGAQDDVKALNAAASKLYRDFSEFAIYARSRLDL